MTENRLFDLCALFRYLTLSSIVIIAAFCQKLPLVLCREWAARMRAEKPDFFSSLANQQAPEYFWIGCSDSRVPVSHDLQMFNFTCKYDNIQL